MKKYSRFKKKWPVAPKLMMIFLTDDFENLALTVQEASALGWSRVRKQSALFVHVTTCLGLAWGDAFLYKSFLYI